MSNAARFLLCSVDDELFFFCLGRLAAFLRGLILLEELFIFIPGEMDMRRHTVEEVREMNGIIPCVLRYEDGKAGWKNFKVNRKFWPLVAVNVCPKYIILVNGNMSLLQADNGDEVRTHLNACQKLWRLADGKKPFEIMEQAELYDALVPVFRRDQVAEAPC